MAANTPGAETEADFVEKRAHQGLGREETGFRNLSPLSIVFVKLFGYFLDDDSEFSDNTADDEGFAIGHEVHALGHVHVLYQSFVGYFQSEAPGKIIAV